MPAIARDADFNQPVEVGLPEFQWPFERNGDYSTFTIRRFYKQLPTAFQSDRLSNRFPIGQATDREHTYAYLIETSNPIPTQTGLLSFSRLFARIPLQQIVPASQYITKPDIPGTFPQVFGSFLIVKPVDSVSSYDAYTRKTVQSDSGAPSVSRPTSGTTVATLGASSTSATAHNAVAATWQTNLNAITSVSNRGNCVVTGGPLSTTDLVVTFNAYAAATVATGSLTVDTSAAPLASVNLSNSGYTQTVTIKAASGTGGAPSQSNTLTANSPTGTFYANASHSMNADGIRSELQWTFSVQGYRFTGGSYTLTAYGQTTASIAYNADAATITAAITAALTNLSTYGTVEILPAPTILGGLVYQIYIRISITPRFTGGTFTTTLFGDTTSAIAYNASLTTIQTALNALTGVTNRGGCVVTGGSVTSTQISFTVQFSNSLLTFSTGSLGPAGCVATVTASDGAIGRVQTISIKTATSARTLGCVAHDISTSDAIFILAGTTYYFPTTGFTILSADSIVLDTTAGAVLTDAGVITLIGRRFKTGYSSSVALSRVKRVTDFYLPGVSPGITTTDDIPLPAYQGDPASLLTAIFAGATTINYEVGELTAWKDSPIFARTVTTLNAATLT